MLNTNLHIHVCWYCDTFEAYCVCKLCQEPGITSKSVKPATKKGGGRVSKKGKETPGHDVNEDIPLPQKAPTAMKKRGEESEDSKYIGEACYF